MWGIVVDRHFIFVHKLEKKNQIFTKKIHNSAILHSTVFSSYVS